MKVGILTFHNVNNYGAVLQNYALQKAIEVNNCEAETIDYRNEFIYKPYRLINLKKKGLIGYILGVGGYLTYSLRGKNTEKFKRNMRFSKLVTRENIKTLNDNYDLFISGSDQVWNYKLTNFDKTYLLDFVMDNNKKVSYAASFGLKEIQDEYCKEYSELLSDFKYLSVREKTGADIVKKLIGQDAKVVADPSFLLAEEDWSNVAKTPEINEDFILVYQLGFCANTLDFVQYLSKKTGYRVICLPFPMGKWIACKCGLTAGPAELLGLIKNAKYVVTSSFHGTIFSILFKKDFFVEIPKGIAGVSSRIEDLLDEFGLMNRFLGDCENHSIPEAIDYGTINYKLVQKRETSKEYLKEIIKNCRD